MSLNVSQNIGNPDDGVGIRFYKGSNLITLNEVAEIQRWQVDSQFITSICLSCSSIYGTLLMRVNLS